MNFLVLTPTRGTLFTKTADALMREFRLNSQYPTWLTTDGLRLIDARNQLARWAFESKVPYDAVLFLDDDVVLPEGAFKAYSGALAKADVALVDYPHHHHPLLSEKKPTGVTTFSQWLPGEDVSEKPIAWSGLGATAMTKAAFEKLYAYKAPLFRPSANPVKVDHLGRVSFVPTADRGVSAQGTDYSAGEDTQFFFDCRALGLTMRLVPGMTAKHLRLEHAVSWVADEKYSTVHTVEVSDAIELPGNGLYEAE